MSADTVDLRRAWATIPLSESIDPRFERFTGRRINRILTIVVAIGTVIIGGQAFLTAWSEGAADAWQLALRVLVFVPMGLMILACTVGRWVRPAAAIFAVSYVLALCIWPMLGAEQVVVTDRQPWIFFPVNLGAVAAIVAFPIRVQMIWAVALPFLYGAARLSLGGFTRELWIATAFDVSFTLILGIVLLLLAWMFRAVGAGVDAARAQAVAAYASASAAAAAEEERIAVAALVHDSVLAALLAAERADSDRERALAVAMAREALTRLANAEHPDAPQGGDAPVDSSRIVSELRRFVGELGAHVEIRSDGVGEPIPERVARAVVLAARQAIANALEYAGGRGLRIEAANEGEGGVRVTISDRGDGFDVDAIEEDRLGIRASIVARMAAVGGRATIVSSSAGTTVELTWHPE